jgi:hypothetical protein
MRTLLVGVCPDRASIIQLVGAVTGSREGRFMHHVRGRDPAVLRFIGSRELGQVALPAGDGGRAGPPPPISPVVQRILIPSIWTPPGWLGQVNTVYFGIG